MCRSVSEAHGNSEAPLQHTWVNNMPSFCAPGDHIFSLLGMCPMLLCSSTLIMLLLELLRQGCMQPWLMSRASFHAAGTAQSSTLSSYA